MKIINGIQIIFGKQRKKSAILVSSAVGLYILSVVPVILFSELNIEGVTEELGVIFMFIFVAIATMLLVYNGMSKPKYKSADDTMVEEFKEWKANKELKKSAKNSINSAIWCLIIAIYIGVSFCFNAWAYSWIIFLIGAAISNIIEAIYESRERRG